MRENLHSVSYSHAGELKIQKRYIVTVQAGAISISIYRGKAARCLRPPAFSLTLPCRTVCPSDTVLLRATPCYCLALGDVHTAHAPVRERRTRPRVCTRTTSRS